MHQWLVVPLIVVLLTATVGRMLVVTPEVGAREAQVLEGLQILRTGALDALALTLHHVFSTPGALAVLAALTAWLAVRRRRPWDAAGFAVRNYADEVSSLISETVERWDAAEASRKIELQVGRDLQFIRINGTVVGALAGLVIHALTQLAL